MAIENQNSTKPTKQTNRVSKQDMIIRLLTRAKGATLVELSEAVDWQEHSIRGFMSGTLKKKLGLNIVSGKSAKGIRRYRIVQIDQTGQLRVDAGEAA